MYGMTIPPAWYIEDLIPVKVILFGNSIFAVVSNLGWKF